MKRLFLLAVLCGALLLCGGCEFKSGDALLQVPQPSTTYKSLQKQIAAILDDGTIQVTPQAGENRTSVQLRDLDLDGIDEAIAFFRETRNPDQFHVYVFKKKDNAYVPMGSVTGTGVQIASVTYPTLLPTGEKGIVISWNLSGENALSGMTACYFQNGQLTTLLDTTYTSFITSDLDGDGTDDLVLLTTDVNDRRIAQLYSYNKDKLEFKGETSLSPEGQSVVSLKKGWLRGYQPAIFAESKLEISSGLMTDIFSYDKNGFRNIALEGEDVNEQGTYRAVSVPSTDVNNDQVTEVPSAVMMPGTTASDALYMLDWYAYSAGDKPVRVCTTYQNVSENWQLRFPENWRGHVTVSRSTSENMTMTTFSEYREGGGSIPLLTIYRLTGDMRDYYASRDTMVILAQTKSEIYTASISDRADESALALTEDETSQRFSIITQGWS